MGIGYIALNLNVPSHPCYAVVSGSTRLVAPEWGAHLKCFLVYVNHLPGMKGLTD